MQTRSTDYNSVCLSVCPSVRQTHDLWQNERKLCQHSYTTWKTIYPIFMTRRMVGGATHSTWKFGSNWPRCSEIADFQSIFVHSASAVTLGEKTLINTNKKFSTRFPMSLRLSSYVAPKPSKGAKKAVFRVKSDFAWRKSATMFLCVKTVSGKVVRHSLA